MSGADLRLATPLTEDFMLAERYGDDELSLRQRPVCRSQHRPIREGWSAELSRSIRVRGGLEQRLVRRVFADRILARRLAKDDEAVAVKDADRAFFPEVGAAEELSDLFRPKRDDDDSGELAVRPAKSSSERNQVRVIARDRLERWVGDDDVGGVGREYAKHVVVVSRLADDERLCRMSNDAGAVDDRDRADGVERGAGGDERGSPIGLTSQRATDTATMKRELS